MDSSTSLGDTGVFPPGEAEALVQTVRQAPESFGIARSRWRLADLGAALPAGAGYTKAGISLALKRLGVSLQRGRLAVHSPDLAYQQKLALVKGAIEQALGRDGLTVLFADEFSFYRHPTLARTYGLKGDEPRARQAAGANTRYRISGALNVATGQVTYLGAYRIGATNLGRFLIKLRRVYPNGRLILVWDNWPIHLHRGVLADASALGIELLWLPTYAPWTNPIEKLWRRCKQEVLHHHRMSADWKGLKSRVKEWLDDLAQPSPDLLRYVGLLPN